MAWAHAWLSISYVKWHMLFLYVDCMKRIKRIISKNLTWMLLIADFLRFISRVWNFNSSFKDNPQSASTRLLLRWRKHMKKTIKSTLAAMVDKLVCHRWVCGFKAHNTNIYIYTLKNTYTNTNAYKKRHYKAGR
jgi:hypothetical protein